MLATVALLAALLAPGLAAPAPIPDIATALRTDPLYVSQSSSLTPDQAAVRSALSRTAVPFYVVVLAQEESDANEQGIDTVLFGVLEGIGDPEAVVVVVTDEGELQAGDGAAAGPDGSAILDTVLASRLDQPFGAATLTGALQDMAAMVGEKQELLPQGGSRRRTVGVVGLIVTALVGAGWLYARSQRRLVRPPRDERMGGWQA